MIVTYDDTKKNLIDNGLEITASKLNTAINYGGGIAVPSGFERSGDISNTITTLKTAQRTVSQARSWLTKTNNAFQAHNEAATKRAQSIQNVKIVKKDLLVK
jgi:hypothetical protein